MTSSGWTLTEAAGPEQSQPSVITGSDLSSTALRASINCCTVKVPFSSGGTSMAAVSHRKG